MNRGPFPFLPPDAAAVKLLEDFLPEKVFDAHAHLYRAASIPNHAGAQGVFCRDEGGYDAYCQDMIPFLPGVRTLHMNWIPMPDSAMNDRSNGLRDAANAQLYDLLARYPEHAGSAYVMAGDTEAEITAMTDRPGIRALKCYCYSTGATDWEQCAISEFLPEAAWEVANDRGLAIILHMMRPKALSDEDNFQYIVRMARRYPNARLVLAHCARSFAAWTVLERVRELADQENIYFDLAAICESTPMAACILQTAGRRVVWGSDYPICMHRGRAISLGTGFYWLTGDALHEAQAQACLLIAENLLAVRRACMLLGLDRSQIEDLFYHNAIALFRISA